jgi:hypothetical protein
MVGGVGEYLSLLTGYNTLLLLIAVCYVGAVATRKRGHSSFSENGRLEPPRELSALGKR